MVSARKKNEAVETAVSNGKGSSNGKRDKGDDFEAFLKDLRQATAAHPKPKAHVTKEERRREHQKRQEEQERARQAELQSMLEQQHRQRKIRQLLQQMMIQRGAFRSSPSTEFHHMEAHGVYEACCGWMQGWRSTMEDAHLVAPNFDEKRRVGLFAVLDGHGGAKCSALSQAVLLLLAQKHYADEHVDFVNLFTDLDRSLKEKLNEPSGSTAVLVLVSLTKVTCSNVGDSRAVLCRQGGVVEPLSFDHKPENPGEKARIEAAGGQVVEARVNGQLAVSRALGDFQFKENASLPLDAQLVVSTPEVRSVPRQEGDEFVVLACDGIFDVLTNEELVASIRRRLQQTPRPSLPSICEAICLECLAPDEGGRPARPLGTDNMTITIVLL